MSDTIPSGWHGGEIVVNGQRASAQVKHLRGVLHVEAEAELTPGMIFRAYNADWRVVYAEPLNNYGITRATCEQAPAGAAKPVFPPGGAA